MTVSVNLDRKAVQIAWDASGGDDDVDEVQVFAHGADGDVSNTAKMPNDGLAVLTYPSSFVGESYIEVKGSDGRIVDSGTIAVE